MGFDASWRSHALALAPAPLAAVARRCTPGQSLACGAAGAPGVRRRRRRFYPLKPARRWIEGEDSSLLPDSRKDGFVLMSYNILGDNNALNHRDLYWKIPFHLLKWDSRKALILQEITRWNADLVCLQEVDRYEDISINMKKKGYAGSYKGRTGGAKDGCAIFWKEKRFCLLEGDSIEFTAFGLRDNVVQLFVFETCDVDSRRLVIGNIHVLFNPKRGDIKLGQLAVTSHHANHLLHINSSNCYEEKMLGLGMLLHLYNGIYSAAWSHKVRILLSKANALSEKWGRIPVVLAGDFNSTPESAIYEFLSTSELNVSIHDKRHLSGQDKSLFAINGLPCLLKYHWTDDELRNATGHSKCTQLSHPLKLHSSYASVGGSARTRGLHGEPLATTYHSKFLGTVDYLWYSDGLACIRVLDTLPIDTLRKIGGLPNKEMGSDHLALVSEFFFADCRDLEVQIPTNNTAKKDITH